MKPETSTNYKKIVDDVLDQINHGQLQKGDKLPTELCLATKFDVSRTCVREAIKSLEAMGIVQSIQGSGSYITNTPELSINRPICALFALSNGTLENVLDLRIVLETDVCRDIIRNATDEEIARVCALADYDYISTPLDQQSVLDSQFHNALMRMSHNALIKYIYTAITSFPHSPNLTTQKFKFQLILDIFRTLHIPFINIDRSVHISEPYLRYSWSVS